ncbi:MAG TPA: TolC family protein [Syntrophorhabdales bacterium]|nr:TolC family protein [Syntrophorhabdales bacterium]
MFIRTKQGEKAWISAVLLTLLLWSSVSSGQTIAAGETLTLSQAIELALKNQPTILAGIGAVRANEARIGEAKSNYYPQLTAAGVYSKIARPSSGAAVTSVGTGGTSVVSSTSSVFDQYTSSVGLNQLVYDFGKTASTVKVQDLTTQSSRFDLRNTQDQVVFTVKQAYYNFLLAIRTRDVALETVANFQKHLNQARGFFEVGKSPKFDVTKAEVDLSNAQLALIKAENQVRLARVNLNIAIGIPEAPEYTLQDVLAFVKYELPFDAALQKAFTQRADLQSLVRKKDSSKEAINLAQKGYYPVVNASASYYYTGTDFPLADGWNYGLNFTAPIFSGYLTKYQVVEAKANYDSAAANERTLRLTIVSQVQQGYVLLRQASESIATSEVTVRQAKENVELALGRYQAGVGSPIEVTDALTALANAEVAYASSLTDYKNAQASIEVAIGARD